MAFISVKLDKHGDHTAAVNVDEIAAFEGYRGGDGRSHLRVYIKSGERFDAYESLDDFVERLDAVVRAIEDDQ